MVLLTVPCWSLVTTEDRAFPPEAQRAMAQAARDAGADIWSEEIAAGHSPMLSRPAETVDFLRRAAVVFGDKASFGIRRAGLATGNVKHETFCLEAHEVHIL